MKIKCPHCGGCGELDDEPPIKLTPVQDRIYRAVRRFRVGGHALVGIVYNGMDGGPDYALDALHVHINKMNSKLAKIGKKIVATQRGPGATYKIINVV